MVSTRQMCGGGAGAGFEETPSSTRASVVRRTTQYQPHQHQHQNPNQHQPQQVASCSTINSAAPGLNFLDLPTELIIKTLGYLDYKKISNLRLVSNRMNDICMNMLNAAFSRQIKTTFNRFQSIKASMPRRESARRNHPLACECDIIETCYMRLSLLQMSMGKHIERGHCCFFPGAILDEVQSILNYISITPRLQRPYRVTDELFDLSTMAMEYFKDRIESTLPGLAYKDFFQLPITTKRPTLAISSDLSDNSNNSPPQNHMVLRKGIRKIKQGMKMYNNQLSVLRTELRTCKRKAAEQGKQLSEQQNLLAEHQKQTLEYANRLDENDKKNEEMARKFSTLLQELNKCKTELQFWRSKSPAIPSVCSSCNQKLAPVLPPEDLQALVNQGVDPENIIIISDEVDADAGVETDVDMESDVTVTVTVDNPFTSPDESTTAKLLAVNSAAKNLKRKYATVDTDTAATSNAIASNVTPSNSKAAATITAQQAASASSNNGYSTKLFYGNHQRSGVIVSPVSMKLTVDHGNGNGNGLTPDHQLQSNAGEASAPAVGATESTTIVELVESKKARRVQKANRCVNAHGKRSKLA
ncbi:F-box only protein 28 [Drosophila innubila]|uniref:F-box only protein 28 n=1 Tax=Drosophila innubila TaxID=198719 RepID=UPI00148DB31A|nr:F-box only protein 28 [Drosophila innubila]